MTTLDPGDPGRCVEEKRFIVLVGNPRVVWAFSPNDLLVGGKWIWGRPRFLLSPTTCWGLNKFLWL